MKKHNLPKIEAISGVYFIKSKGKIYIGSSINCRTRIYNHLSDIRREKHQNLKIKNHFLKHGLNDLEIGVLEKCDKSVLIEKEQYWIDFYESYNENNFNIHKSASFPFKELNDEQISKRRKIFGGKFGVNLFVYNNENKLIKTYSSLSDCSRDYKVAVSTIHEYCNNKSFHPQYIFSKKKLNESDVKEFVLLKNKKILSNKNSHLKNIRMTHEKSPIIDFYKPLICSYEISEKLDSQIPSIFKYHKSDKHLSLTKDLMTSNNHHTAPLSQQIVDWLLRNKIVYLYDPRKSINLINKELIECLNKLESIK